MSSTERQTPHKRRDDTSFRAVQIQHVNEYIIAC